MAEVCRLPMREATRCRFYLQGTRLGRRRSPVNLREKARVAMSPDSQDGYPFRSIPMLRKFIAKLRESIAPSDKSQQTSPAPAAPKAPHREPAAHGPGPKAPVRTPSHLRPAARDSGGPVRQGQGEGGRPAPHGGRDGRGDERGPVRRSEGERPSSYGGRDRRGEHQGPARRSEGEGGPHRGGPGRGGPERRPRPARDDF